MERLILLKSVIQDLSFLNAMINSYPKVSVACDSVMLVTSNVRPFSRLIILRFYNITTNLK